MKTRPKILFLMSDEHRADVTFRNAYDETKDPCEWKNEAKNAAKKRQVAKQKNRR